MEEIKFIDDTTPDNKGLDFLHLRGVAIQYIQDLTGAFWTDFNEHDPGITILEQLCYALTELSYRTNFPTQDLLLGNSLNKNKIFYQPHEILAANPQTIEDFRKLIIDSIPDVRNVWFEQTPLSENSLKGLYKIYVDLYESTQEEQAMKDRILEVFCQYRNLCEDVEKIIIMQPLYVSVYAQVEIDNTDEPENILANLYYNLNLNFNPEIHFYSLPEMLAAGHSINHIYEGPLLKHGFIKNKDLYAKTDRVLTSELMKILMQVSGIVSVKNLYLQANGEIFYNQLNLADNQSIRIIFGTTPESTDYTLQFLKSNLPHNTLEKSWVQRKYNELVSANKRTYRAYDNAVDLQVESNFNLSEYLSIQNHFPIFYGIGTEGIPDNPTEKRKAQAKQLKAYLLFFEQVIANYFAQLANVKELFSSNSQFRQSYFYQNLTTIPNAQELFEQTQGQFVEDVLTLEKNSIPQNYADGLKVIMEKQDNYLDRRNRFLDFILAVHGESYQEYAQAQKQFYPDEEEFALYQIESKTYLLDQLDKLGLMRATAYNYLTDSLDKFNFSGLELKIMILLGMGLQWKDGSKHVFVRKPIFSSDNLFEMIDTDQDAKSKQHWQEISYLAEEWDMIRTALDTNFDLIDEADLKQTPPIEENLLEQTFLYQKKAISTKLIREGIALKNYRIGNASNDEDKFYLLLKEEETWQILGAFNSYEQSLQATKAMLDFFRNLNLYYEKLYLVEHILLRPSEDDKVYGFYLVNQRGEFVLKSKDRYTFKERRLWVQNLEAYLFDNKNYSVERREEDGNFEIHFQIPNEDVKLISIKSYESVQQIHEIMEDLFQFLANQRIVYAYEEKVAYYIQHEPDDMAIPEYFFNYHASIVIPSWSARFANTEFRDTAQMIIRENCPAYISPQVMWLQVAKMQHFEDIYYRWVRIAQQLDASKETKDVIKREFILFLAQYYQSSN